MSAKFPRVFLRPLEEAEILRGFPWVYGNEIASVAGEAADGDAVEAFSSSGLFLGTGILNQKSKIVLRLLCRSRAETLFDSARGVHTERSAAFFRELTASAASLRAAYYSPADSYRLCFAEADGFPGLIVERFADADGRVVLVFQFLSLASEVFRQELLAVFCKAANPDAIYDRSDAPVRALEGLPETSGWLGGESDPLVTIRENGVLLSVDVAKGQKTGYFLDQKANRRAAARFARGARVLDLFSHTGAFGLNAARAGAQSVLAADISAEAVDTLRRNVALNGANDVMRAVEADAFDVLRDCERAGERFDLVVLDPPAFARNARSVQKAFGGYKEINLRAMRLLSPGGILVSCSCSQSFDAPTFYAMIQSAAADARRRVQILEKRGAGTDHPVLAGHPKSEYLKCAILRVL